MKSDYKNTILYSILVIALIWCIAGIFRLTGIEYLSPMGSILASACMLIPLLVVIILHIKDKRPVLKGLGIHWKINRWWFVGWLIIPVLMFTTIGINLLLPDYNLTIDKLKEGLDNINATMPEGQRINMAAFSLISIASGMTAGITINALFAFSEEIGWRGYLIKELYANSRQNKKARFWTTSLQIGLLWGFWHTPLIMLGHNYPNHPYSGVLMMCLLCIAMTPLINYIRLRSKSVIAAAITHGTLNGLAGFAGLVVIPSNDLICGMPGISGIVAFLLADLLIYLFGKPEKYELFDKEHLG